MNSPEKIKLIRNALRLTQSAFAEPLGVVGGYISTIEAGKEPSKTLVALLRQHYRISDHWWETGEGEIFTEPKRPPEVTNLSYAPSPEEAMTKYFMKIGLIPSVGEKVNKELGKLDESDQLIAAGKILKLLEKIHCEEEDERKKENRG